MSVDTTTFEDVVAGIDEPTVCESPGCEELAEWVLRLVACGHVGLHCRKCRRDIDLRASGKVIKHASPGCGKVSPVWRWEQL